VYQLCSFAGGSHTQWAVQKSETLFRFSWRTSGPHQVYIGVIAIVSALLNFAPVDLQKRIVDGSIVERNPRALFFSAVYLAIISVQSVLKYVLLVYQGWISESVIKLSRDQLATIATHQAARARSTCGQIANVFGAEIDSVGGFIGTSISEFVVNLSFLIVISAYMLYIDRARKLAFAHSAGVAYTLSANQAQRSVRAPGRFGSQTWR
jgi:hypothetical protein